MPENFCPTGQRTDVDARLALFRDILDQMADGIYVIDKDDFTLLYANESRNFLTGGQSCLGEKCYAALHKKTAPCSFCCLKEGGQELTVEENGKFYSISFCENQWNSRPAYVNIVRDVTKEVSARREKEQLEEYFRTVLKYLPGGVAVVRYERDGSMKPEFMSDGFAQLTGMPMEEAWKIYKKDAMAGVHPDDMSYVSGRMAEYVARGEKQCEIIYRIRKGDGSYIWVKNRLTMIHGEGGRGRVYAVYHDMSKELEEKAGLRKQYKELLMQHYHTQDPNALVVGHCNITQNRILEISDHTDSGLLDTFGYAREDFFTGMGTLVVDEEERKKFYGKYLNDPARRAFIQGEFEQKMECFVRFPKEKTGRYVQILMNLVSTPDTGDITGILTVTDITREVIADKILRQLSVSGYDYVADIDLLTDDYRILSHNENSSCMPPLQGKFSSNMAQMTDFFVVPRDREKYRREMGAGVIMKRLRENGPYTFSFSVRNESGDIRTKSITVSEVDLRISRICLARNDITDSVREQQGMLRLLAYTFELACFIKLGNGNLTMYTRETVLENLPPFYANQYEEAVSRFILTYAAKENREKVMLQFSIPEMIKNLEENPDGYDFLFTHVSDAGQRYKQINVMWGDVNHTTICLVRADVTDMLTAERRNKKELEDALELAKDANRAKSDFLSAMSHDIRTPMNAIMGMTMLASANIGNQKRVEDCLEKISVSSKHLLSLINDILDMSKIERSQITLNRMRIFLPDLLEQLSAIMAPQAREAGLTFSVRKEGIRNPYFYGDTLRINQILINLLSNAVKYTPEGGSVEFLTEEAPPEKGPDFVRYRFRISDTGVGMSEEFLTHVFSPFTRSQKMECIEGTGLGLSITKGLVELMEGNIRVSSRLREGSVFTVELEYEKAQAPDLEEEKDGSDSAGISGKGNVLQNRRFLVAEDNAINAEILCEILNMYGADAVVKNNGLKAVQEFEKAAPGVYDAVLMDIQMPEMNGYEATRAIRSMDREDAARIPIVAMTANAFSEDVQAAREAGMTAHVAKPVDVEVLVLTLKDVLSRKNT